jgi:uncharacterized protein
MTTMQRRTFLKALAGLTMASAVPAFGAKPRDRLGALLPRRALGRTGETVTMLGVGGFHIGWTNERDAQAVIEAALEGGVRFFDTAESYARGESESRFGNYLTPNYRDDIFLMTKSTASTAEAARAHLEDSLRRMKTDTLDLWQIHALASPADVDRRIDNGVLDVFRAAREEGIVRFIGFTGHADPRAHLRMLERTAGERVFDACQLPVNPVDAVHEDGFTMSVLPLLIERGIAPLAMKSLADGRFFASKNQHAWKTDDPVVPDRMSIGEALAFTWSLPISVLIAGAEHPGFIRDKIDWARKFTALSASERAGLIKTVADLAFEGRVEYYKAAARKN